MYQQQQQQQQQQYQQQYRELEFKAKPTWSLAWGLLWRMWLITLHGNPLRHHTGICHRSDKIACHRAFCRSVN